MESTLTRRVAVQLPTDDLVLRWLDTCDATSLDRELIADLVEHAREAEPIIPQFAEPWLSVEPQAAIIHAWALDVLPGLLQTYDYAFAMFITGGSTKTGQQREPLPASSAPSSSMARTGPGSRRSCINRSCTVASAPQM